MPDNDQNPKSRRDVQAFIVGALVILGLIFATYTYFNDAGSETQGEAENERESAIDKIKDMISSSTTREEEEGVEEEETGESTSSLGADLQEGVWVATDYEEGDIDTGSYTVKSGDTLWEIAEAVYGNGSEWTTILNANSGSIGTLPNGQQALIMTGQVLTIPQA